MATITDVAKKAGVSIATVSRAMNSPESVTNQTLEAVRDAMQVLNYRPNRSAQALKLQSSRTVGVVLNSFNSPYFGELITGIDQALRQKDFKTIAEASHQAAEGQIAAWTSLMERQCEAFVVHADMIPLARLQTMLEQSPTSVIVNRRVEGFDVRCVYLDNFEAGETAAQTLLDMGHRDIAMLVGPAHLTELSNRRAGFLARLERAGVALADEMIADVGFQIRKTEAAVAHWLDTNARITAIFAYNDIMAAAALSTCRAKGVRVPEDISIMGFDGVEFTEFLAPKLTTMRQPLRRIGAAAAELAYGLARPDQAAPDIKRVFHAELIQRDSIRRADA